MGVTVLGERMGVGHYRTIYDMGMRVKADTAEIPDEHECHQYVSLTFVYPHSGVLFERTKVLPIFEFSNTLFM